MDLNRSNRTSTLFRKTAWGAAAALVLLASPIAAHAQSASIFGQLGNFDAANFEGQDAFGFEVQLEGVQASELTQSWTGNKFGNPKIVPYATGVYVRYQSPYDAVAQRFTVATVPHAPNTAFAGTCYMGSLAYWQAGCDHFGVHMAYTAQPTATAYRWMFADPANPGQLIASANNIFVPTPVYTWLPPATPAAPPVLVAEIRLPDPPPAPVPQYGDATWVKVFKTELAREVALDELTGDNPIVPQDATQVETAWKLMQASPPGARKQRGKHVNQGAPNSGSRSVIRRYETYTYTGAYNPVTHEAMCGGDATCNSPMAGELGDMQVVQMAAANIGIPGLAVTKVGSGNVQSGDKLISCGSKCAANYAIGTVVTLTAQPASNNTFGGWTGACVGAALNCVVTINDSIGATATFNPVAAGGGGGGGGTTATPVFTVSIGRSNPGTVTSDLAGINCGSACSAKFAQGVIVTLTATPPAGKTFASWGGGCSGTASICIFNVTKDTAVQANFNK